MSSARPRSSRARCARNTVPALATLALATLAGCGGSSGNRSDAGPGDMGATVLTPPTYCTAYADALCTWGTTCLGLPACADWLPYVNLVRECDDGLASLGQGLLTFDVSAARACVDGVAANACDGGFPFGTVTVCREVFLGTVAPGDACMSADFALLFDECAGGHCVRAPMSGFRACAGTCSGFVPASGDCSAPDARCEAGLFCNEGTCGPGRAQGAACDNAICATGLSCLGEPLTCQRVVEVDGDCTGASVACAYPAVCIGGTCTANAGIGQVCANDGSCADGLYCRSPDGLDGGLCAAPLAAAAACDPDRDRCLLDYSCRFQQPSTCVVSRGGLDDPCGPEGCLDGLWCHATGVPFEGTCRAFIPLGDECPANNGCVDGLFCAGDPWRCVTAGALGDPCNLDYAESCMTGGFCDRATSTCAALRAEGQRCHPGNVLGSCVDGYCACLSPSCPSYDGFDNPDDVCVAFGALGDPCTQSVQCASGHCDVSGECASPPITPPNCTR